MEEPTAVWTVERGYIGVRCAACDEEATDTVAVLWCADGHHYICAFCCQDGCAWCAQQEEA